MHHLRSSFIPVGASVGADWSSALAGDATTAKAAEASGMKKVHLAVRNARVGAPRDRRRVLCRPCELYRPAAPGASSKEPTPSSTAHTRASSACRCRILALSIIRTCSGLPRSSLSTHPRVVCALARFSTPRWACCPRSTSCTFSSTSSRRCASTVSSPPLRHFFFSSLLSHISKRRDSGQDEAVVDVGQRTPIHVDCTYSDLISIKAGSLVVANNF